LEKKTRAVTHEIAARDKKRVFAKKNEIPPFQYF